MGKCGGLVLGKHPALLLKQPHARLCMVQINTHRYQKPEFSMINDRRRSSNRCKSVVVEYWVRFLCTDKKLLNWPFSSAERVKKIAYQYIPLRKYCNESM